MSSVIFLNFKSYSQNLELSRIYPDSGFCSSSSASSNPVPCVNYGSALIYCDTLTEGGNTDWFLPTFEQLNYCVSGGAVMPDSRTADYMWTSSSATAGYWNRFYTLKLIVFNSTDDYTGIAQGAYNHRSSVRCVRIK